MGLKLKQLQHVVKNTVKENKATDSLRNEITRVFGPMIDTDSHVIELARAINERVEVLNRTGRKYGVIKPSALLPLMNHGSADVRKMVANLIPESFLHKLATDGNVVVREAVARRAPLKVVKRLVHARPGDHSVIDIYRDRLHEAKEMLTSEEDNKYLPTDESIASMDVPDLTDGWYRDKATEMVNMYGTGPEFGWEEQATMTFCNHMKATNGVIVDYDKLLDEIYDIAEEREDQIVDLKELAEKLKYEGAEELINETLVMPVLPEEVYDPVSDLNENLSLSDLSYANEFGEMFSVKLTNMNDSLRKHLLHEGLNHKLPVPSTCTIPFGEKLVEKHEIALDRFIDSWNRIYRRNKLLLNWSQDPMYDHKVRFSVRSK